MIEASYYNENEPYCYAWLENLIKKKLIPKGDVDGRSIVDVPPEDVKNYRQAHFFAGIGVWAYAARKAGWKPQGKERLWTGSCPCQPFSSAAQEPRKGFSDERHLWPTWYRLIKTCRPELVLGEQIASALARSWLAAVHADFDAINYTFGAVNLQANNFGQYHERQRFYYVAHATAHSRHGGK